MQKSRQYYINPASLQIIPESPFHFRIKLSADAHVLVYEPSMEHFGYRSDGSLLSFKIEGGDNRYFRGDVTYYIYLTIARGFSEFGSVAYLCFSPVIIPFTEETSPSEYSNQAKELLRDRYYLGIGALTSNSIELDTGCLGTEEQQNAWRDKLADVPTRIEVQYRMPTQTGNMLENSETPHVEWGGSLDMSAKLIAEWATDMTEQVNHWSIVRKSDDTAGDTAWNAGGAGTPVQVFAETGSVTLLFNATQNDLGTVGAKTEFTLTAYGLDEEDETQYVALAARTILITHTDLQTWVVDYDAPLAAISVDSVGNVKGGLWTGSQQNPTYRLSSTISVRRGSGVTGGAESTHYLTPVNRAADLGPGKFRITAGIGGDVTLLVDGATIYVTAIAHLRDGSAGDEWDDSDYAAMREMRYAEAVFRVNCEGLASIEKKFRIAINHDDAPYITMEMAPTTAEVIYDEKYTHSLDSGGDDVNTYSAANSSFEGLPTVALSAKWRGETNVEEAVAINGLTLTLDGTPFSQVQGASYTVTRDNTRTELPENERPIIGFTITALPKPAQAQTLLATRTIGVALTAKYAGVDYERTLTLPVQEHYKLVTSYNERHFLLTAEDDWGQDGVPPRTNGAYGTWTTVATDAVPSEQTPYMWYYDETIYSNGRHVSGTPQLGGNWAESAVTYFMTSSLSAIVTESDGSVKAGQNTIVVTPFIKRGNGTPGHIHAAGFRIVETRYNIDGTQAGEAQVVSSTDSSDFSSTWSPADGLGRIVYELCDSDGDLLCAPVIIPYISDGAAGIPGDDGISPWVADLDNEMDSIHTTADGNPTDARSIVTTASLYHGETLKNFVLQSVSRNGTEMTYDNNEGVWVDTGISIGISGRVITVAYGTTATISGLRDVFTFTLKDANSSLTRSKSLSISAVSGDIYNIVPSAAQISAQRTSSGGYNPSTFTLTCGYARKSIDGSTESVADVTGSFGGYNLYYRKRQRSNGLWGIYLRYDTYKNSTTSTLSLTNISLDTFDEIEFVISTATAPTITKAAMGAYKIIDRETVAVVADGLDGDAAVRYYLVVNPGSLALAAGGDTFTDGTTQKDISVQVYKQIGFLPPTLAPAGEFRVGISITTRNNTTSSSEETRNSFTISNVGPSIAYITLTIKNYADTSIVYETRTVNIQAAGRRGYQGPTPRRREWVTPIDDADEHGITYQSGAEGETYKDFIVIKDADGVVHQYECIQTYTVTASNADATCPLLPDGSHGADWSTYWREATDTFDFVTTNILLSNYILAESGAFDGLNVNWLTVGRNSYIGGFAFNKPYTLLPQDVKICVNPYNYGMTDFLMWASDSAISGSPDPSDQESKNAARIYKSGNIIFPDCGSSIVIDDSTINGRFFETNTLNGISGDFSSEPQYLYVNLPFYAPFRIHASFDAYGFGKVSMSDAYRVLTATGSDFLPYITEGNQNYDAVTHNLMQQIDHSESLCNEYLGARITIRNNTSSNIGLGVVIYGVKGLSAFAPHLSDSYKTYCDFDPWGRTSFFWRIQALGNNRLPYLSLRAAQSTIDANRFVQDNGAYLFETPDIIPTFGGLYGDPPLDFPLVGQSVSVKIGTCYSYLFDIVNNATAIENHRAELFSVIYDAQHSYYTDPLSASHTPSAFQLESGRFVTLEMSYEEGDYFWRIINYV